jgi:hypothetical protein
MQHTLNKRKSTISCCLAGIVTCTLLVLVTNTAAFGQDRVIAGNSPAGDKEDLQPSFPQAMVDRPGEASCCDLGGWSCCHPQWTAAADFIILDRVGTVPYALVETVPHSVKYKDLPKTAGTVMLNATDLQEGFSGGPQLDLIHHGDDGTDLEVSYFQIDGWNDARCIGPFLGPDGKATDWLVMRAPGNFLQTQNADDQSMTWDYASRLYNAEVNIRRNLGPRVTVLAGFRWINLAEGLEGILLPPSPHGTGSFWDAQTRNNLYGFQMGMDAKLLERNRFSIDSVLKVGIFDDHADETSSVRMERIQFGESDATNGLAFVGQLGVRCKYQVTQRLSLKVGYELIWLQGVALAPGQISDTYCHGATLPQDTSVQALGVNCSSGIFYHGATAGLEYSF